MNNWQIFSNPEFKLQFKYPGPTPKGFAVEKVGNQCDDALRVHISSKESSELYLEIIKFQNLEPKEEYERHKAYLIQNLEGLTITKLQRSQIGPYSAQSYNFTLPARERKVFLLQKGEVTYHIIFDPLSELNHQVITTIEILDTD